MVLIVESRALQAVASAACFAMSVTPHPVRVVARARAITAVRILMKKSSCKSGKAAC
jgi:phosphate-selective porin